MAWRLTSQSQIKNGAMRKINSACCLLAAVMVIGMAQSARAQRPAHYYPARPAFSSYLLYRQLNATGIPNYYSYVRPATQYRDFLARNPQAPNEGRQTLMRVEREVARVVETQLRQRTTTGIGQPSVPAQFGEMSHFYPRSPVGR